LSLDLRLHLVVVMSQGHWEHYSHPADIGIRGIGPTREEAFAQAALALTAVVANLETIEPKEAVEIVCQENDDDLLFYAWLGALLYEMGTRNMLFSRFEIQAIPSGLKATAWGERVDAGKHEPVVEVKAATYADLKVRQDTDGNWMAQCVVDV
jgi:SHS2 domain-containing protein